MNKAQRVKAVMERKEADFVPAGFWFHYKPDFTVEEMIEEHLKLYRETDMDVIKIMQDYAYPVTGEIHCAEDWYHIGIKGTDSREKNDSRDQGHKRACRGRGSDFPDHVRSIQGGIHSLWG